MALKDLGTPMPIYTTRPGAEGTTGTLSISIWIALLMLFVITLNVIGWGAYSLVLLAKLII